MEILGQNTILAYADDIVITCSSRNEVEMKTADLIKAAEPIGLNQKKMKYLVASREASDQANLQIGGYIFQQQFSHLQQLYFIFSTVYFNINYIKTISLYELFMNPFSIPLIFLP